MISKYLSSLIRIFQYLFLILFALLCSSLLKIVLFIIKIGEGILLGLAVISFYFLLFIILLLTDVISLFTNQPKRRLTFHPPSKKLESQPISIIILNWNGAGFFEKLLPPLIKQIKKQDEIIVVDNHSTDDSLSILAKKFPQVKVLALDKNYFFSKGNNFGLETVKNPLTIFLNNDMVVEPHFLDELRSSFSKPEIFSVSSQIFFWDKHQPRQETGRTHAQFRQGKVILSHLPFFNSEKLPIFWSGGGSSAYATDKLKALGGFSELYAPFYWEDVDLSYQSWKRGWVSLANPKSAVLHKHQGSMSAYSKQFVEIIKDRNRHLFTWANLYDAKFIGEYFLYLLPRIILPLLRNNFDPAVAFCYAMLKVIPAMNQRRKVRTQSIISDQAIFAKFKAI